MMTDRHQRIFHKYFDFSNSHIERQVCRKRGLRLLSHTQVVAIPPVVEYCGHVRSPFAISPIISIYHICEQRCYSLYYTQTIAL